VVGRVLAWAAVLLGLAAPGPAAADTALFAWMLFDQPAGWVRENKPGLMVLSRDAPAQAGKAPGRAVIMVAHPDAAPGPLDAAFRSFVGLSQALAAERPLRHGEGVTVNGDRILWEMRCCNSGKAPGMMEWNVGIGAPGRNVLLKLLMWTALGRQRLSVLSQHSRFPSQSLCFVHGLLVGVDRGSGQLRPYVRPVARRVPLAIMGVRSRVRHQSDWRAQGTAA